MLLNVQKGYFFLNARVQLKHAAIAVRGITQHVGLQSILDRLHFVEYTETKGTPPWNHTLVYRQIPMGL